MTNRNKLAGGGILLLLLATAGCSTLPALKWPDPPKNEPTAAYHKKETAKIRPATVTFTLPNGQTMVGQIGYSEDYSTETTASETGAKPNVLQKLRGVFGGFWFWVFIACCIFIPGFAGVVWILLQRLFGAAGQMVSGIENFLQSDAPSEAKEKLLASLGRTYDNRTKRLVADIKAKKRG